MKTLKITLAVCLLALGTVCKADNPNKSSAKYAADVLVDAYQNGNFNEFSDMLDKSVKLTIKQNKNILSYNRKEIIDYLAPMKDVKQNCRVTATTDESIPGEVIVKVNMKYEGFTRVNTVSLSLVNGNWKITNISSAFV